MDISLHLEAEGLTKFPLKANKLILGLSSTYFKHLFETSPIDQDEFVLKGISGKTLVKVLEFLHNGSTTFWHKKSAENFLEAAEILGLVLVNSGIENESEIEQTNQLFKQISKCVSLGFETKQSKKIGSTASSSVSSSVPIKADKKSGMSGDYWQCQACQYWCFRDSDIRRHEAKSKCFSDTSDTASNASFLSSNSSINPIRDNKISGISNYYWRCQDCQYWTFRKSDISQHKAKHSTEEIQESLARQWRTTRMKRARALKRSGVCGSYYQCNKCTYWAYKKQVVKKHQQNVKH